MNENNSTKESETLDISYKTLYKIGFVFILLIVLVMIFSSVKSTSSISGVNGNMIDSKNIQSNSIVDSGSVQIAKMKVEGSQYTIIPNIFKSGIPVRIEADISQMPGCSKSVVISGFGIRKTLTTNDNVIEFTPDKAGTFNLACSMNMYRGTFTVLQSDGSKAAYIEIAPVGGHTCGSSAGGCGCGG